ncbi:MAG TPA: hypothetical protein PKD16_17780 [Saprospiraceae bacterium]|jgi:hypothetical protein|nr:hypothetical protein [Saprospiraceae bacterium]HMT54918.1 hypothetical protein [Saprospiraceae bacterium]HMT72024.1 hypothetical protein [Saprospiraceae bacterium]
MFGLFKKKLPHCDELFIKYLSPWYNEDDRPKMTRPDMYQIAAFEGQPLDLDDLQYLMPEYLEQVKAIINDTMTNAALEDFSLIYKSDTISFEFLDGVDTYYDRVKITELIKDSDPKDFSNPYLVTVCEFGVLLGQLFRKIEGYDWLYSHPYYHSIIVHKETGMGITVFDWAVKKFSEYGVDDGYVAKFHAAIEEVNSRLNAY